MNTNQDNFDVSLLKVFFMSSWDDNTIFLNEYTLCFLSVPLKLILRHLQDLEKVK